MTLKLRGFPAILAIIATFGLYLFLAITGVMYIHEPGSWVSVAVGSFGLGHFVNECRHAWRDRRS